MIVCDLSRMNPLDILLLAAIYGTVTLVLGLISYAIFCAFWTD